MSHCASPPRPLAPNRLQFSASDATKTVKSGKLPWPQLETRPRGVERWSRHPELCLQVGIGTKTHKLSHRLADFEGSETRLLGDGPARW